jgi:hypothetical protein
MLLSQASSGSIQAPGRHGVSREDLDSAQPKTAHENMRGGKMEILQDNPQIFHGNGLEYSI